MLIPRTRTYQMKTRKQRSKKSMKRSYLKSSFTRGNAQILSEIMMRHCRLETKCIESLLFVHVLRAQVRQRQHQASLEQVTNLAHIFIEVIVGDSQQFDAGLFANGAHQENPTEAWKRRHSAPADCGQRLSLANNINIKLLFTYFLRHIS